MSGAEENKPCLVESGRGFSVEYKGKLLYSRYNPQKNILQDVSGRSVLRGTLILCCSPCLGYGLEELAQKLPEDCLMLGCEADEALYHLAKDSARKLRCAEDGKYRLLAPEDLAGLPELVGRSCALFQEKEALPRRGVFRRSVRIDFSAGVSFSASFYGALETAVANAIGRFWKNRLTLIRLGRRYSANLFRNLACVPGSVPFEALSASVTKPILALGAGPSLAHTLETIRPGASEYFILAADAVLPALTAAGIRPDGIVCEEAQIHIAKAFVGGQNAARYVFASLSSCPHTACLTGGAVCWHTTLFDDTDFFARLMRDGILPHTVPPLGSVGLTAVGLALRLRAGPDVPVYVSGLDFSYTAGVTHARGTFAAAEALASATRLRPAGNYGAAFGAGTKRAEDKAGNAVITTTALSGYAETFSGFFSGTPNLFDSGISGLPLGLPQKEPAPQYPADFAAESGRAAADTSGAAAMRGGTEERGRAAKTGAAPARKNGGLKTDGSAQSGADSAAHGGAVSDAETRRRIASFLNEEKNALEELCKILSQGQALSATERNSRITQLLKGRAYLYLHFPDGERPSLEVQFLKRVRTEAAFFLKDIRTALAALGAAPDGGEDGR